MTKIVRPTTLVPPRVFARARPEAVPLPARRDVAALTPPEVFDRWNADAAGVRAVETGDNVITIFDVIGEDFWTGEGFTAKKATAQLRAIGPRPVEVHINSPGGDIFEGLAIYNVLREHPQPVTVKVMGLAASAASIVLAAGDTILIGAASFVMIHNCWVLAIGDRNDMRKTADYLEPFDKAMADVYSARTGQDVAQIAAWMDAETYMSGATAIERGFADDLLAADQVKVDAAAKAADRKINQVRALELTLVRSGMTRSQARSRIAELKGMPGAALPATPGAGTEDWSAAMAGLIATIKS